MNGLALWVHTPVAQAVGWALIHFLWEGAALAAVLAAPERYQTRLPANYRWDEVAKKLMQLYTAVLAE